MKDIEAKLQRLITCIGEKKLKQLGLLTCKGCNRIFAEIDNLISEEYAAPAEEYAITLDKDDALNSEDIEMDQTAASIDSPITFESSDDSTEAGYHNLPIGYIYSNVQPLPTHEIMCPECGRLFILDQNNRIMPLAVSLTPSENEIIKGVYVDILL